MSLVLMSSQRFLNEEIVLEKMKMDKRWIHISPPFFHDGSVKSVLLDGHHSLEASKRLGEMPLIDIVEEKDGCEIELIFQDEIEWFLDWNKNDDDYYEIFDLPIDLDPVNI